MGDINGITKMSEKPPQGGFQINLLGPVTGRRHSQDLDLGEPRQQAILCVLAVNAGQVVTKEQLIDGVWGEDPPKTAEQSVYTYVSRLRRTLEPDRNSRRPAKILVSAAGGYALQFLPGQVDSLVFEQHLDQAQRSHAEGSYKIALDFLDRALKLWQGTCLSGIPGPFAEFERHRLGELHLIAMESRAELLTLLGRPREAIALLVALVSEHPLRERLRELHMIALYHCGRQAEALDVYQGTRRLLLEELGIEPNENLRRCHKMILCATPLPQLTSALTPPALRASHPRLSRGLTPAGEAMPCQLPRAPVGFVGRTEELIQLRSLLFPWDGAPPHHVVAITGAPGSGKSTLAVQAAHMVRDRFPDGQLYANLHGATPGIRRLEPIEVLGRFLRDLGVSPHTVPTDLDEATAMWRSKLDGREILVMLDDAADLAQIRPLLSIPVGNTILTTSRENFALLDDCACVPISRMRRSEASAMLAKLAGAERVAQDTVATTRLISLCGGLPLAVGIAGARLANRPRWGVADLVERLNDEQRRLHELQAGDLAIRTSLTVSYDLLVNSDHHLDRTAARALRALGLLQTADMSSHTAGTLLGVSTDVAERALERLVDAHLAEEDRPGRYRLHDLVRLFAKERVMSEETETERDIALDRALSSYVATTLLAVRLCGYPRAVPTHLELSADAFPLTSEQQARDWLNLERAGLLSAATQAMTDPGERIARLGATLAFALFWPLHHAGLSAQLFAIGRQGLAVGLRLDDDGITANAHNHTGLALNMVGRVEESLDHLGRQLALCRRLSDLHGEQKALGSLAMNYLELGRYEEALECGETQLEIVRRIGDGSGEHYALTIIGSAYHGLRLSDRALSVLGEALANCRRDGNLYQETSVHEKLGGLHLDLGDAASARASYEAGLDRARTARLSVAEPYLLLGLARSLLLLGETEQALTCLECSVASARTKGNDKVEKKASRELAAILTTRERPPAAPNRMMAL